MQRLFGRRGGQGLPAARGAEGPSEESMQRLLGVARGRGAACQELLKECVNPLRQFVVRGDVVNQAGPLGCDSVKTCAADKVTPCCTLSDSVDNKRADDGRYESQPDFRE